MTETVHSCDRCKSRIEGSPVKLRCDQSGHGGSVDIDLCPECREGLVEWLKYQPKQRPEPIVSVDSATGTETVFDSTV